MNILQSLVNEAQQKKKQLQNVVSHDVVAPVQRDVVAPVSHAIGNTVNAVSAHNTIVPAAHAITQAPQAFITHVAAPVDNWAIKSPIGRGAQSVALGALQAGTETAQGISGLGDALNHKLNLYQGASPTSVKLTNIAKSTDVTAKNEHSNPLLYHGSQVATNLLGLAAGSEAADATKAAAASTKLGKIAGLARVSPEVKAAQTAERAATISKLNTPSRIVVKAADNIRNPGYQATNAAFTALQSGQQIAQGRKVTPKQVATNLAIGGVAFPVAGAIGGEAAAGATKLAKEGPAIAKTAAKNTANTAHDIISQKPFRNVSDAELASAQKVRNSMQGYGSSMDLTEKDMANYRGVQKKLGVDINNHDAVDNVIGARRNYQTKVDYMKSQAVKEGGYAKIPGGGKDPAPDLHPQQKEFINQYANMLKGMGEGNGVSIHPDGRRISNNARTADTAGKNMTQYDWFQQARKDIESGKAAYGASEDYAKLPTLNTPEAPLTIPAGFETPTPPKAQVKGNFVHTVDSTGKPVKIPKDQWDFQANLPKEISQPAPTHHDIGEESQAMHDAGMSQAQIDKAVAKMEAHNAKLDSNKPYDMSQGPPDFLAPTKASAKHGSAVANDRLERLSGGRSRSQANGKATLQKAPELPYKNRSETGRPPKGTKLLQGSETAKPKASSKLKYTENPTKVDIPAVTAGDYEKARGNAQLASAPINYSAGQAARSARNMKLSTSKLGRLVEGTDKPANASEAEAIRRYQQMTNRVDATSSALGAKGKFIQNYFHHEWDLSKPEDAARFEEFRQRKFGKEYNHTQFAGLDQQPRVFDTVAQGEKAGFKLKHQNAADDILAYGNSSAHALRQQALAKGFAEADANQIEKPHSFDIGQGKTIALSDKGRHEIRAFTKDVPDPSVVRKGYRATNRKLKQTLLSASEFHPINITKKVAPGLALEGHPVLAAKGAYGAFRAQVGRGYSDKLQQMFQDKGIVDFGARVGSPLKFGSDYATEGKLDLGHAGFGEKTIFEKSMPALHGRALQALKADLDARKIPYDSKEARAAGTRINEMMGFVNTEFRNLDKGRQRALGDIALAPQFTRAKWATLKSALKDTRLNNSSLAGSYARRAIVGESLTQAAGIIALGYLVHQKSDNIRDMLIRAIVHPSVPTPMKDSKGNTIELGLPSTYTSEVLGLVANIQRGKDGHLQVTFKPGNIAGNVENYGRSRLALVPGAALKIRTNTDFANKPLYDPNASLSTQAQQAATTLLGGSLPIGAQGILYNKHVMSHLPQASQQILEANQPGSNPLIKSVASSFGLTPRTDKTVGKGQQTTQYFNALDSASKGLNHQEKDAFDLYTGGKKNPVTGQYEIPPTANDSRAKAVALLQNPKVIDRLIAMNKQLASQGQSVDPLWSQSKDRIEKYLQYQAMPPAGPDRQDWINKNPWYNGDPKNPNDKGLAGLRNTYFNALPKGDPNKPKLNIQYPDATPAVQSAIDAYNKLTDSTAKGDYLNNHPEIINQWNAVSKYNNQMRQAQGYASLKDYPTPAPQLQKFIDSYTAADKTGRKGIRNSNPQQYQNMIAFFDSLDLHGIGKQAAVSELQGEPDYTSQEAKQISSLAKDVYQNPDGTYSIVPAGWMNGLSNSQFGYTKKGTQMSLAKSFKSPTEYLVKNSTKGASLARSAHLAGKPRSVTPRSVKLAKLPTVKKKALA